MTAVPPTSPEVLIPKETLNHLEEVLHSRSFTSSPRCQEFLRFVVHELVEGRGGAIKERTIALEVFGKSARFDPGSDSLVRVKAREVRKRLAEFYESAPPDLPLRFELPLGSYLPVIRELAHRSDILQRTESIGSTSPGLPERESIQVASVAAGTAFNRRRAMWLIGGAFGVCAAGSAVHLFRYQPSNLDLLWKPVFAKDSPLLIFIPLLPKVEGDGGGFTDRVGMGTTAVVSQAAQYLTQTHHPYRLRFGADLTFSQLREQPSLLLGGFSSQWTIRMTHDLRFNLVDHAPNEKGAYVLDNKTGRRWGPVIAENGFADNDYSLLCRLFDASSGQVIFIAAGITTFGTESAASFLFSEELFASLLKGAPSDWQTKNFQVLIQTAIIGVTPSTPRVLDSYFW
jgi:hypothetical protein